MEKTCIVNKQKHFFSVRQLTMSAILSGLTIFLGLTGYGFVPLVFMNATVLHIPTIIGTLVGGPKVGVAVGFLFGLFSFIQSIRAPSLLLQFALTESIIYDAFICIVPRMCICVAVWTVYKYFKGNETVRVCLAAVLGTVTNTVLFLGTWFVLIGQTYSLAKGIPISTTFSLLTGIVAMNGIPEALLSGLIVTPIIKALKKAIKN